MTSNLIVCILPVNTFYSSLSFQSVLHHFSFFFFAWRVIIQRFSRATICDPAEGPGQFPEHTAMTDALCARTQEPEFNSQTFPALMLQNPMYIHRCGAGDYSPLWYGMIHLRT